MCGLHHISVGQCFLHKWRHNLETKWKLQMWYFFFKEQGESPPKHAKRFLFLSLILNWPGLSYLLFDTPLPSAHASAVQASCCTKASADPHHLAQVLPPSCQLTPPDCPGSTPMKLLKSSRQLSTVGYGSLVCQGNTFIVSDIGLSRK